MFHFPAFPPRALYIQARVTPHDWCGVSPFGDPRITVRLPTPRGISQATTSFFGSWCQGIHPVPLQTSTTENKDARVHCAVLKQRPGPPQAPPTTTTNPQGQPPHGQQLMWKTHGPDQPHHPRPTPTRSRPRTTRADPTKHPPPAAVPSGPNSVSCTHRVPPDQEFQPRTEVHGVLTSPAAAGTL